MNTFFGQYANARAERASCSAEEHRAVRHTLTHVGTQHTTHQKRLHWGRAYLDYGSGGVVDANSGQLVRKAGSDSGFRCYSFGFKFQNIICIKTERQRDAKCIKRESKRDVFKFASREKEISRERHPKFLSLSLALSFSLSFSFSFSFSLPLLNPKP